MYINIFKFALTFIRVGCRSLPSINSISSYIIFFSVMKNKRSNITDKKLLK